MKRYKGKAARWQQQDKEEQRMNKTEFIKVRCTLEEKQRIKLKAESAGRKFSDYCREILLNGERPLQKSFYTQKLLLIINELYL